MRDVFDQRSSRGRRGSGAIWVFFFFALLAVGVAGLLVSDPDVVLRSTAPYWILGVCLPLMAGGLWVEARRDAFSTMKWVSFFGISTAVVTGLAVSSSPESHPIATAVSVLSAVTAALCGASVIRTQRAKEVWPNLLVQNFPGDAVHEVEGVQFVAMPAIASASAGEPFELLVFAQNCFDAPRTFKVELKPEARLSLNRKRILVRADASITLKAGEVAKLALRCVAERGATGSHPLRLLPETSGSGGTRVRKWRAAEMSSRIPPWVTLLGTFAGFLAWGGGMSIRLKIQPPGPGAEGDQATPSFRTETLWLPSTGQGEPAAPMDRART